MLFRSIGLQQLSEASDSSHRYKVLQRIGASNKQVKKVIFQQVLIYFITPLLLAIPHAVFAILFAHNTIIYSGNSSIITTTIASVIVFLLLYGAYFIATYSGYKRITKS